MVSTTIVISILDISIPLLLKYTDNYLYGVDVSMEEIRALILSLGKRHISSRDYVHDINAGNNIPEEDTSGRPHSNQVAIITKEGVHIHMKYIEQFNRSDVDPVRDIIERMTHQHARSKRMILASCETFVAHFAYLSARAE